MFCRWHALQNTHAVQKAVAVVPCGDTTVRSTRSCKTRPRAERALRTTRRPGRRFVVRKQKRHRHIALCGLLLWRKRSGQSPYYFQGRSAIKQTRTEDAPVGGPLSFETYRAFFHPSVSRTSLAIVRGASCVLLGSTEVAFMGNFMPGSGWPAKCAVTSLWMHRGARSAPLCTQAVLMAHVADRRKIGVKNSHESSLSRPQKHTTHAPD